jgi:hypothetical protein
VAGQRRLKRNKLADFELVLGHDGRAFQSADKLRSLLRIESTVRDMDSQVSVCGHLISNYFPDHFWIESGHHSRKANWIGLG